MQAQAFGLLLIAIVMTNVGELLLKHGMTMHGEMSLHPETLVPTMFRTFTNPFVLAGFVLVFGASIFWLAVLSRVELSWAYPMLSLGYVLVVILSALFLNETITLGRVLGILIIISGVFVLFRN